MDMRNAAICSGVMHGAIMVVLAFGLPSFVKPYDATVIPVDVISAEDLELPEEAPEPPPEPPPEPLAEEQAPEPEPRRQQASLEPPPPAPPAPRLEPEPLPEPAEAEPEPEPLVPPPEAKPEPKPEPEIAALPQPPVPKRRPVVKMAAPKPKAKPKRDQLTSILRNVEKLKDQPRPAPEKKVAKAPKQGEGAPRVSVFERNELIQEIQRQVRGCWRLDPGALEAEDMVVEIHVTLNPDGSVRQARIVDVVRMVQDAYFRSAAENARRAINKCSPFKLPHGKYSVWRELTLRFNPREMFGT